MPPCSTVDERSQWGAGLLAPDSSHGVVSQLRREHEVSRQTLNRRITKAETAMQEALSPNAKGEQRQVQIERAVLTLLIEGHSSYRGIQTCMRELLGETVSLGTIVSIVVRGQASEHRLSLISRNRQQHAPLLWMSSLVANEERPTLM